MPADNVRGSALLSNFWKSPRLNDNAFPLNSKLLLFFFLKSILQLFHFIVFRPSFDASGTNIVLSVPARAEEVVRCRGEERGLWRQTAAVTPGSAN